MNEIVWGERLAECFGTEGLYNLVTKRIRLCKTIFEDRVKLSMRQEEQSAFLEMPYLIVYPTTTRGLPTQIPEDDLESITLPHTVVLTAQFYAEGSEAEWKAANQIEIAEKELMTCLCNWRPVAHYYPTAYMGKRIQNARAPDVKASYEFRFHEPFPLEAGTVGLEDVADGLLELEGMHVRLVDYTCCEDRS